jgi:hypothetical protein
VERRAIIPKNPRSRRSTAASSHDWHPPTNNNGLRIASMNTAPILGTIQWLSNFWCLGCGEREWCREHSATSSLAQEQYPLQPCQKAEQHQSSIHLESAQNSRGLPRPCSIMKTRRLLLRSSSKGLPDRGSEYVASGV